MSDENGQQIELIRDAVRALYEVVEVGDPQLMAGILQGLDTAEAMTMGVTYATIAYHELGKDDALAKAQDLIELVQAAGAGR